MKIQKSKLTKLAYSGAAGFAMAQAVSAATTITNNTTGAAGNNVALAGDFGSNISTGSGDFTVTGGGTPDVALTWSPLGTGGWENYDWNGNGGVMQVDEAGVQTVVFTPSAGFSAIVTSADFDFWTAKDGWTIAWSVIGDGSTNESGVFTSSLAQRRETVNFSATGAVNEVLTLSIQQTHGNYVGSFAIDNLAFDQVAVPEPASSALLTLGLGAMAMRRRRA